MSQLINLEPNEVEKLIDEKIIMIDVRRENEFLDTGIIKNSIKLTFFDDFGNYDIENWMNEFQIQGYDETNHSGCLRYVMIRHGFKANTCMVVLVTLSDELPAEQELIARLTANGEIDSIIQNINPERVNRILGERQRSI